MPYTIRIAHGAEIIPAHVGLRLCLEFDESPFVFDLEYAGSDRKGSKLHLRRIRLKEARPYCGQHPGPCILDGRPKRRSTCLEWADWIAFNDGVNRALGDIDADVWSTPMETNGRMWIRRGTDPRVRYDWTEKIGRWERPIRIWNLGTPDQFASHVDVLPAYRSPHR